MTREDFFRLTQSGRSIREAELCMDMQTSENPSSPSRAGRRWGGQLEEWGLEGWARADCGAMSLPVLKTLNWIPLGMRWHSTTGKCTVWVIKIMSSHPTNPKHTTPFKRIGIGHMEVLTREMNGWYHIPLTIPRETAYGKQPESRSESPNFRRRKTRDKEDTSNDIHCQNYSAGDRLKLHLEPLSPACHR